MAEEEKTGPEIAPTRDRPLTRAPHRSFTGLFIVLGIGLIIGLGVLTYNLLFPKEYWQSRELQQNQAKWDSLHITHYRMSIALVGYGLNSVSMPVTVEVRDAKVVSMMDVLGRALTPGDDPAGLLGYSELFTVPGLFSFAQQRIAESPAILDVSYDDRLGYPARIYVDPYSEPCCQDYWLTAQNFQVLPP